MPSLTTPPRDLRTSVRVSPPRRRGHLNDFERRQAYEMLLTSSNNGALRYGVLPATALHFGCHLRTLSRLWDAARLSVVCGSATAITSTKMKGRTSLNAYMTTYYHFSQARKRAKDEIEAAIRKDDHHNRQTLRTPEAHTKIPKTLLNHMKESKLKAKSSYTKPMLTDDNKEDRFRFALNFLQPQSNGIHSFSPMHEYVHVDEKRFFLTKAKKKFYVYEDETLALRAVKNKKLITKVMFLAAVARTCYDSHRRRQFDGKIGIWSFVECYPPSEQSRTA
ncbi:Aste57867_2904 [Aphanomyces stellatus]|uniref:Aste57867_2904 protein n=1 Tax=Aphanomyces stellatus TaxID=120398 RepID=A0A485K8N8_9STRA|nr:hypothetical protein As57867_002896 [Aphanomyces stellatus]VFT80088.1 Aste57867_2904 [Aphanomyces stellatus]